MRDVNNSYTWSLSGKVSDGTAFKSFLASLNGGDYYDPSLGLVVNSNRTSCFANHCDWRLPSIVELQRIVNTKFSDITTIDHIFGDTHAGFYWLATTFASDHLNFAWSDNYVRAVRSGL